MPETRHTDSYCQKIATAAVTRVMPMIAAGAGGRIASFTAGA
jgi:hypothetical protein